MASPHPSAYPEKRPWREIARELQDERNPEKITKLCVELNESMLGEEREKVAEMLTRYRTKKGT